MTIEAGVVIGNDGEPIYWHLPQDRSVAYLPDSKDLWDIFWENRFSLKGFAHSHPGYGVPSPSWTDITTFAAVEAGLGRRIDWWICSGDSIVLLNWVGPEKYQYSIMLVTEKFDWIKELRNNSKF